jgi:catechol 2,3-dioxygenase-like lactoylglutathione lyase family enzyme
MRTTLSARFPAVPRLNAIGIAASNLAESRRFYGLLGLEVPESGDHLDVDLGNGMRLMFDTEDVLRSFDEGWTRTNGNQLSLAFECESPAQVDEVYAAIVGAGFKGRKEPWDAFWGQRYAQVSDPDGVPVDLYAWS